MTRQEVEARATQLFEQLGEVEGRQHGRSVVALVTTKGSIFGWHTHKLKNLRGVLEHYGEDGLLGFIEMRSDEGRPLHIEVTTLSEDYDVETMQSLFKSIDWVWNTLVDDLHLVEEDINEEFEFPPSCSTCGHVLPKVSPLREEDCEGFS